MTDQIRRISHVIPLSQELVDEQNLLAKSLREWFAKSSDERAAIHEEAATERGRVRETVTPVGLTVESLLGMLDRVWGVDQRRALHMVQSYCECEGDSEGGIWSCQHWRDLDNEPA